MHLYIDIEKIGQYYLNIIYHWVILIQCSHLYECNNVTAYHL
jgi:hypothetical protein